MGGFEAGCFFAAAETTLFAYRETGEKNKKWVKKSPWGFWIIRENLLAAPQNYNYTNSNRIWDVFSITFSFISGKNLLIQQNVFAVRLNNFELDDGSILSHNSK